MKPVDPAGLFLILIGAFLLLAATRGLLSSWIDRRWP